MESLYTDEQRLFDADIAILKGFYKKISELKSTEQKLEVLTELYKFINEITPRYILNNYPISIHNDIKKWIYKCESLIPSEFIIESNPVYEYGSINVDSCFKDESEMTLDYIVQIVRDRLTINERKYNSEFKHLNEVSLTNKCEIASCYTSDLCREMFIRNEPIIIWPGFTRKPELYDGNGYHCINIVTLKGKRYIIDCTYRQFFTVVRNNLERIKVMGLSGCHAGIFMTRTKERLELANQILKYGWFEATPENIKNYFDGYAISYRNGHYYETTSDYSYTTPYLGTDYLKFMDPKVKDDQVKREGEEVLGFQRTLKPINK